MAVPSTHLFWLSAAVLAMTVGSLAFLLGSEYGLGLAILSVLFFGGVCWIALTLKFQRSVERLHTYVVKTNPKILTMIPVKAAKLAARQRSSRQTEINNYLTGLAKFVDRRKGYCECCGTTQPLLDKYPFDAHFHSKDCEVAIGWRDYGNPETCPWGILFELPQPVLVGRLSSDSLKGLYRFAVNQAETYGYGDPAFFRVLGLEYLRHDAISASDDFLERVGRKVAQEYQLEGLSDCQLQLTK